MTTTSTLQGSNRQHSQQRQRDRVQLYRNSSVNLIALLLPVHQQPQLESQAHRTRTEGADFDESALLAAYGHSSLQILQAITKVSTHALDLMPQKQRKGRCSIER